MIRQEMVGEEKWITPERFNRVLALYQVLPGPERTSCVCILGCCRADRSVRCWVDAKSERRDTDWDAG
jgi:chromate transport protein ChrA